MTKDDMISLTQKLEALKKLTTIEHNRRSKKKLIDEMENYLGFYILDYVDEINQAGNIKKYELHEDIAALVSVFLFFKTPSEGTKEVGVDDYISNLSLTQKISEVEAMAKTIKSKINKKGNPRYLNEKEMRQILLNEKEYNLWKFLKTNKISFQQNEKTEIPESVIKEYIETNEDDITALIKEQRRKPEYKNIISKMKKAKELNEIEKVILKHALRDRFVGFLNSSEGPEIPEAEIENIVDNHMLKIDKYQEAVRHCDAATAEIKKEFEEKVYPTLKMGKYYSATLSVQEAQKKITEKISKINKLKEQLLQEIREFEAENE